MKLRVEYKHHANFCTNEALPLSLNSYDRNIDKKYTSVKIRYYKISVDNLNIHVQSNYNDSFHLKILIERSSLNGIPQLQEF